MHHLIEAENFNKISSQLVSENNGTLALGSMKSRKLISMRDIVSTGRTPKHCAQPIERQLDYYDSSGEREFQMVGPEETNDTRKHRLESAEDAKIVVVGNSTINLMM